MRKKSILFALFITVFLGVSAAPINLWGININKKNPELTDAKVVELTDKSIFNKVRISGDKYIFANDNSPSPCTGASEKPCFDNATKIISEKFGTPMEVYTITEEKPFSIKASFLNVWKYNGKKNHYSVVLYGSGDGMTLSIKHFSTDKQVREHLLNAIKTFNYTVKPELQIILEK